MVNFLFMDEGYSSQTRIFALTGVLIPAHQYSEVRRNFYELFRRWMEPESRTLRLNKGELHGQQMLRWMEDADDDMRIAMFEQVVGIMERSRLHVYRVGYFWESMPDGLRHEQGLLGLCWFGLVSVLQPLFKAEFIVPVMDTVDARKMTALSGMITSMDKFRALGLERDLSISNSENILGEVFYADSKFSVCIQLADVIGYLRQITDRMNLERSLTPFQERIRPFAERLNPLIREDVIWNKQH